MWTARPAEKEVEVGRSSGELKLSCRGKSRRRLGSKRMLNNGTDEWGFVIVVKGKCSCRRSQVPCEQVGENLLVCFLVIESHDPLEIVNLLKMHVEPKTLAEISSSRSKLIRWATCWYIAQLFRLWKCFARLLYRVGRNLFWHSVHWCRTQVHAMTCLLIPLSVSFRSYASFV